MWKSQDDIDMIKTNNWPCEFALAMKRPNNTSFLGYEHGCIAPMERTVILKTSIFDFNPFAKRIEYGSVEEMVTDGWMVD